MGNKSSSSAFAVTGKKKEKIQASDTTAKGKKHFTNCVCIGCGWDPKMCEPMCACDQRCCCLEHNCRVDPRKCVEAPELCKARAGVKVGPIVVDAKNPLIDNHELVVVAENKLLGCNQHDSAMDLQTADTVASGKTYFTNCVCVGCGIEKDICRPLLAGEARCCCMEAATRADCTKCQRPGDCCEARVGVKAGPIVLDAKNPLADRHAFVVVLGKRIYIV